uniref:Solute carrier family 66 member 3 n=2 Tax=Pseudo-nitzschia australis TaxID=44445 RepID=A0A7S4EL19_9STRA|eukprot:CAMPEP_0168170588 /NCGR_PEP_ID=MMETSP0139_2-20121125/4261_1 /TAXON_ID=44445 /ORGANISM="Pseudo-nitzschia australis, Strain 10249 10 AB" /LENGTH=258 /DNA_ID=CAMNT_0008088103 /DNA_START=144 /DNA_END=920 /DNA_ORIENTATION=-
MVALIDIPFVQPLAEWIWGEEDASTCLSEVPFISAACFSQLVTKGLGITIIFGSMLNKVPIMVNMIKSQSAAGISRKSLYGEAMVCANSAMYGFLSGFPFTAYGETVSLLVQNAVLIVLAWNFLSKTSTPVDSKEKMLVTVGFVLYFGGVLNFVSEDYWYLLMSTTWPVMLYARGSQVYETFSAKQTGNLSIVTTSMNVAGSLIRILTTIKETGDMVVLSGYLLSGSLSLIMFIQYWMYLENTTEMTKKTDEAKKKKE